MKRSDARNRIELFLLNMNQACSLKEQAESILEYMEELGMLPPTDQEKSFQILPSGEMTYQVNEWEKE